MNKKKCLAVLATMLFLMSCSPSQKSALGKFKALSGPEKCWTIGHIFVAKRAMKISSAAVSLTDSIKKINILDQESNGGQLDAFRHTYWMASLTQEIGAKKAEKLGIAHEKGNRKDFEKHRLEEGQVPDSISSVMDLHNNCMGIHLGSENRSLPTKALSQLVIDQIKQGSLKIIARNKDGKFVDCEGKMLTEEALKGKWKNAKCLVNSDYIPK